VGKLGGWEVRKVGGEWKLKTGEAQSSKLKAESKRIHRGDAKGAEKSLKKIGHPRGIGSAFHRAGRPTQTHTDG
jgi:hypothetical protein